MTWGGDLIKCAFDRSSVGTLVDRKTRFVGLCKIEGNTALAARAAEAAGADVLIVQGVEAGGHVHDTVAALVLVEQVARATSLPIIASGGFGTGAGRIAALTLGA